MTNKSVARSCDDIDDAVLNCAEVKTLATGDPRIKEKMQLDNDIYLLQIEKAGYQQTRVRLQNIIDHAPNQITELESDIDNISADIKTISDNNTSDFAIKLGGVIYTERAKAAEQLQVLLQLESGKEIGEYRGLQLLVSRLSLSESVSIEVKGEFSQFIEVGTSSLGNITRIENCDDRLKNLLKHKGDELWAMQKNIENARAELLKPFAQENMLNDMRMRQIELNSEIELEQGGNALNLADVEGGREAVDIEQKPSINNSIER